MPAPLTRLAVTGVIVTVALVAVACGIPTDHAPRAIARGALPAALAPQTTTTLTGLVAGQQDVRLFLVRNEGGSPSLAPVTMAIGDTDGLTAQVRAVMTQLIVEQPATSGATQGLTNTIPESVRIIDLKMDGDVADLDVSNLDNVESTQQRLAFAEMVYTATDLPGVDAVRFSIDHRPTQVPLDSATSKLGQAIDRSDYGQLAPTR